MVWSLVGLTLALAVAATAWRRGRVAGGFYDRDVYGMNAVTHRRYAIVSVSFAAYFATAYGLRLESAGVFGLALYALIAILYATSFLQGAHDPDE
jgi:hypothetical protein